MFTNEQERRRGEARELGPTNLVLVIKRRRVEPIITLVIYVMVAIKSFPSALMKKNSVCFVCGVPTSLVCLQNISSIVKTTDKARVGLAGSRPLNLLSLNYHPPISSVFVLSWTHLRNTSAVGPVEPLCT